MDEALRFERLRHHRIATGLVGAVGIERLERAGEKDHRDRAVLRMRLHEFADFVSVLLRHDDVGEDDVGAHFGQLLDRLRAVIDRDHFVIAVGKREFDDLLDGDTVIREKDSLWH